MSKQANPIHITLPLVRIMVRKRSTVSKWETHKGKVGRVFNAGKYMIATYPKRSSRCPKANYALS